MSDLKSKILVLDSGVGGLTVLTEIKRQMPRIGFDYLADYAFMPYGGKGESELEQRIELLLSHLNIEQQYAAIVIACNSASTVVLDYLRQQFAIPFIGVVPAIKVAGEITKNKVIGLLATQGTVEREYTQQLIADFANHCRVVKLAAPTLVDIAERKFVNGDLDISELEQVVEPLTKEGIDTCVLGCTHFSWVQQELQQISPQVRWIDSCDAIARRVEYILREQSLAGLASNKEPAPSVFMSTEELSEKLKHAVVGTGLGFHEIKLLGI